MPWVRGVIVTAGVLVALGSWGVVRAVSALNRRTVMLGSNPIGVLSVDVGNKDAQAFLKIADANLATHKHAMPEILLWERLLHCAARRFTAGSGVTLGTLADNGFTFRASVLTILVSSQRPKAEPGDGPDRSARARQRLRDLRDEQLRQQRER